MSRYWAYTQQELIDLMRDFQAHEIPLSVCIVDMDWHITNTGNDSSGWTGYTWNRDLFPDPASFIAWLHQHGIRTALNLHPADGVYPHEEQYADMARVLNIDTNNPYQDRRPWAQEAQFFQIIRDALQLRHQLIPYIYTMAWRNHVEGLPLITPMYYKHPEAEAAYRCPQQYRFGSELIVAPFTSPLDPDTRMSRQQVWLPDGDWFNFFTGDHYSGGRWITVHGALDEIPRLAPAGAIVPQSRTYRLIFRRIAVPAEIHLAVNGVTRDAQVNYAEGAQDLVIELPGIAPTDRVEITLRPIEPAWPLEDRRAARCRHMLQTFRMESESKRWIDQHLDEIVDDVEQLRASGPGVKDAHIAALRNVIEGKEA